MGSSVLVAAALVSALSVTPGDTALVKLQGRVETLRPAEVVAAQVRGVLWNPASVEAWQALAGALPDLIVGGAVDVAAVLEAARVADEMSGVPVEVRVPATLVPPAVPALPGRSLAGWLDGLEWPELPEVHLSENETRIAIWAVIAALTVLVVPPVLRRGSAPPSGESLVRSRLHDARAMAGAGRSIPDIARETHLAQEALSVLLRSEA